MFAGKRGLNRNESGEVAYSTLFILLSFVTAGAVFTTATSGTQADLVQKAIITLALALIPLLILFSSALWLAGKPADELQNTQN